MDITEREQAEAAFQENLHFLETLLDTIPSPMFYKDARGIYTGCNPAFAGQILGLPKEKIIGRSLYDMPEIIPHDLADIYHRQDLALMAAGGTQTYESKVRCADGIRRDFVFHKATFTDAAGTVAGLVGVMLDVSERKEAERRYRDLFDQAPLMYVITRAEQGRPIIEDCNNLFLAALGCSRDEVIGQPLANFYSPQSRAELLAGGGYQRALSGAFAAEERELVTRDGSIIETMLRALPETDAAGTVIGTRAMFIDITERKRAEQAQHDISDALQAMHAITSSVEMDFDQKISQLLKLGCQWFKLPIGILSRVEGDRYHVVSVTAPEGTISRSQVFPLGSTYCRDTLRAQAPLGFTHAAESEWRAHPCFVQFKLNAYLGISVRVQNEIYGTLNFSSFDPRPLPFTATDEAIIKLMTQWVGGEIARSRSNEEAHRRNRELTLLNQIIAASAAGHDPARLLDTACRELAAVFEVPLVVATLLNPDKTAAVITAEHKLDTMPSLVNLVFPVDEDSIVTRFSRGKQPWIAEDAFNDPRLADMKEILLLRQSVSVLVVPLIVSGEVIGSLTISDSRPRLFPPAEVNLAMRVADQVAGVLARARLNEDRRRLSAAIEQTAESIIITDTGGRIEYVNPGFEKTTGYTRAEALGRRLNMLYSGHHDAAFYSNLWQTISSGKVWHGQFINRKKNGDLYNDDATITPGRDDSGAIVNYVSVQRDVTRELQLEAQYRQAQKMDAIGQLTGGIAHDFNNLLTAINGFADLARAALEPDDPKKEMMDKVLYSGQRAADLVRQLLAFSRKQVIEPKVLNLNTVVTDTDKMLRRILGEHIFIDTRLVPRLYPVKIDPAQIQQVILNMAVNARDAMPDGGRLTIETVNVSLAANDLAVYADLQPGDYVQLTMRDTGHGMTSAVLARVFEPFFTTKEVGKGTGLGLATVYGIVKQNGGDIVCHSEVGRGATFRVLLPVSREGVVTEAAGQSGQWPAGEETILLVEDDPMVREFVLHTLRAQGYNIIVAANGPRALQMAQAYQEPIHLLLTDVVMPGMSGSEVAERLRAQKPGLKIIFTSGYTDETVIRHGVQESELTFLPKPFSPMELAKKVREILDQ